MKTLLVGWTLALCAASVMAAEPTRVSNADELRHAIEASTAGGKIVMSPGVFFIDTPIVLTPKQSGITVEADGKCIISGGRKVEGWHAAKLNCRDCWAADLPDVKAGQWFFHQLWIDGQRAVRARTPDRSKYFHVKESPDAKVDWQTGQTRFRYDADDIPAGEYPYGAQVVAMCRWIESRLPIKSIDPAQHLISFTKHSHFRLEPGDPYFIEGDVRCFDQPGEWFLDRATGVLYYLPLPGQEMSKIEAFAPKISVLMKIEGSPTEKKFVEKITLRGITFSHTEWMPAEPNPATTQPGDGGFDQAAAPVPAVFQAVGLRDSIIDHCTIEHVGNYALELGKGCSKVAVSHCTFRDLGAGGLKIGEMGMSKNPDEQNSANRITDCEIADGGWVYPSGVGIWVGQSFDNLIAHNHIHDFYYSGISTGWSWGYGESFNRGNIVEKNHVHHIGKRSDGDGPILSDMGAIYTLGSRTGCVIRNNIFHDVSGIKYGGWGVYLDEGSSDTLVENNLIYRTTHGSFHLHYGQNNVVRNNILALARQWQVQRTREEPHIGFTFEHNIVYWTEGPLTNTTPVNSKFDHNLYGPQKADQIRTAMLSLAQWQAAGMDVHSVVEDPKFSDPGNGKFELGNLEAAKKIGFVLFDTSDVGPRK